MKITILSICIDKNHDGLLEILKNENVTFQTCQNKYKKMIYFSLSNSLGNM